MFTPICPNFDTDMPVETIHEFNHRVFEKDRLLIKAPKPECLPLDPTLKAHIMADRSSISYRKGL